MLGKILFINDNSALIEYKAGANQGELLNINLIFENDTQKILGEVVEIGDEKIRVKFLGEFINGKFVNGLLRKANLNSKIRAIKVDELKDIIGVESKDTILLGSSTVYKGYYIYPSTNELFANHMCIFGNSGSGKSCGVARLIQNILANKSSLAYNANLIFFDSFGEYNNAFKDIGNINEYYHYRFLTTMPKDESDELLSIPMNLLTDDDIGILLQAEKHSQLTIIERAIRYAKIFSVNTEETHRFKNNIIAKAILTVLYSNTTSKEKKDEIVRIINRCHTPEVDLDIRSEGSGYSRSFSECFAIDNQGRFGEEVLITNYILKFLDTSIDNFPTPEETNYTLEDLAKSLEFTLISDGFNQNSLMHDDAELLKVRLNNILHSSIKDLFNGEGYVSVNSFITHLLSKNNQKAQIINISLEGIDDAYAKAIVKIFSRIIFEFAKSNSNRATIPFHLFLEEAHRYVQKDIDVFLLGYNIFDRIAKEGRKYGVLLNIISQRPVDISDTVLAQCSDFLIFKMTHPKDIKYIGEILPNISQDVIEKMKVLQPGTCVAFGSAFKIPMICKLEMPSPSPHSSSCNVSAFWDSKDAINLEANEQNTVDQSAIEEVVPL